MRILFFPSDLGGGLGDISRCIAVAEKGRDRGHECAFVLNEGKYSKRVGKGFKVYTCKESNSAYAFCRLLKELLVTPKNRENPVFTEFSGLEFQVVRDGFVDDEIIKRKFKKYLEVVREFKANVLVGDTNFIVWMLGVKTNLPVVQIVRFASHPKTAKLIWWKDIPKGIVPPDCFKLFNPLLIKMGITPIMKVEDLFQGDLYIVPSDAEVEPIPKDESTVHVGQLTVSLKQKNPDESIDRIGIQEPIIYITIGGGRVPLV